MNKKELELKAEEYALNWEEITGLDYENCTPMAINKLDFINGAISNAAKQYWYAQFEKQKLEFAIEELNKIQVDVFAAFVEFEVAKSASKMLSSQIQELEQKLGEYE